MTDQPRASAEIERSPDGIVVTVAWDARVDRNRTQAWCLRDSDEALAQRLKRAVDAQAVCLDPTILTDNAGKTYVGCQSNVVGRNMNADLRRIGY